MEAVQLEGARPDAPQEEVDSLEDLRARLDKLDSQIAHLLQERAAISLRVGQTKNTTFTTDDPPAEKKAKKSWWWRGSDSN